MQYYCSGDFQERIYDEPNTANTWWNVDVSLYISPDTCAAVRGVYFLLLKSELPNDDIFRHCYLPLHFWLDKGMVTRRVKKYPMLLQPAWLPRQIRNGSGNGGGVLLGYMPIVGYNFYKCQVIIRNKFSFMLDTD